MGSLRELYPMPDIDKSWSVPQQFDATFDFEYDDGRTTLMHLYQKGKDMQWDAVNRIDWSLDLDEENPMQLPDEGIALKGSPIWDKMSEKEKILFRRHAQSWNISQFMQGEQAALICASKIVQQVPDLDAKFYASTQVMDEARHVEAYKGLMNKFGVSYPMTPPLAALVDDALRDSRWDFTYLAMQVVIEGLALAAFGTIRDLAQNPLAKMVNAYVMEDEARHVAFGRLTLRDYYPELTQAERDEREEFLVEACYHMRDRFQAREVYETLDLPVEECVEYSENSEMNKLFRTLLFQRIVPVVKDIGLWGDKIQKAYTDMGVMHYADQDLDLLAKQDEEIAKDLDKVNHQDVRMAYVHAVAGTAE
ncbi:MAG: ferritin-like domain-containing protein [Alphaproteobacteria bacterium]|nr:ferritin-like domain-containing protein [Alphaproteobacteria bacterium]